MAQLCLFFSLAWLGTRIQNDWKGPDPHHHRKIPLVGLRLFHELFSRQLSEREKDFLQTGQSNGLDPV